MTPESRSRYVVGRVLQSMLSIKEHLLRASELQTRDKYGLRSSDSEEAGLAVERKIYVVSNDSSERKREES